MLKTRPRVILDISDSGVSGLLVVSTTTQFSAKQELPWQGEVNLKRFLNDTAAALKQVISDLLQTAGQHGLARPHEIDCFLAAPFYASQARTIRHIAADPFIVTRELVANLIRSDLKTFADNYPTLHSAIINDHQRVIESKIMEFKLNRYSTRQPYDQTARELEVHNYVSLGSDKILSRLEEIITAAFHHHLLIRFHSASFALFHFFNQSRALGINIGAEVTEVLLISDGVLADIVSFPAGRNFLIRHLAERLGTSAAEATSTLQLELRASHHPAATAQLGSALETIKTDWLKLFAQAVSSFLDQHLIPPAAYLLGNNNLLPLFSNWVGSATFNDLVLGGGKLKPQIITQEAIAIERDFCDIMTNHGRN